MVRSRIKLKLIYRFTICMKIWIQNRFSIACTSPRFFGLVGQKRLNMLFFFVFFFKPILGHFWCSVVILVSKKILITLKKNIKKTVKTKSETICIYTLILVFCHYLNRALHFNPFQNPGLVPWAWQNRKSLCLILDYCN